MNINFSKSLGLIAAFYFAGNVQAQVGDTAVSSERKIEEVVVIGYGTQK